MASLDSAKCPSAIVWPFFQETILPSCNNGWADLIFPCSANRSNQIVHWLITFWSSSGDRLLSQYEPRNRSICSGDAISVFMILVFRTCSFPDQPFVQFGRSTKEIEPSISIDSWLPGVELARHAVGCSISNFFMLDPPLLRIAFAVSSHPS